MDEKLKEAGIKLLLDNFKVLATHLSQNGETKVLQMKVDLVPMAISYKSRVRLLNPDQKDNLRKQIDSAGARSHRTVSESLGVAAYTGEEEGWQDKVGHRPERVRQADGQGQLPPHEYLEILHSLQDTTVLSSLDACGAYQAVRIKPRS